MIIVTGTKRSGTSMWMQALQSAGVPVVGTAFPRVWEESIKDANPRGFFESRLRNGIYYRTNPNPKTGAFLRPKDTRKHAVKVFIPGLIRSDYAYLHRVIATVRPWRAYSASIRKLFALEDEWLQTRPPDPKTGKSRLELAQRGRAQVPPAVEWWFETYDLVRDVATRRYPFHAVSYDRVIDDPEAVFGKVIPWLGVGSVEGALAAIDPALRRSAQAPDPPETAQLPAGAMRIFDDYYTAIHETSSLPAALISDMNGLQKEMERSFKALNRERTVRGEE